VTASPDDGPVLARVLGDTPAAALLVDLAQGVVVSADGLARQMAPRLVLPASLEQWAAAAQLQDPAGGDLADGVHPLRRMLRRESVTGHVVSVARDTGRGEVRELRWVVALPLGQAAGLAELGLVLLSSVRAESAAGRRVPGEAGPGTGPVSSRSVLLETLSYSIADVRTPDAPLVWTSPGFTAVTGYDPEDVRGRNCRFLQGPGTSAEAVARLRAAMEEHRAAVVTLLNYTRDGRPFWNQVTLNPVVDASGATTHVVGVQNDVSDRHEAEQARDAALAEAREALARAARSQPTADALTGSDHDYSTATSTVQVAASYLPAEETVGSGSDFYDVHEVSGDRVRVAVGGARGDAARGGTATAQLQQTVAALARAHDVGPASVLERVDLLTGSPEDEGASVWLADLARTGDRWRLRASGAGRATVVVREPEAGAGPSVSGTAVVLDPPPDPPLGHRVGGRGETVVELSPGSTVVACSDGVVRRPGETPEVGLLRLQEAVSSGPTGAVVMRDHLLERLVAPGGPPVRDDVVVLVVHLDRPRVPPAPPAPPAPSGPAREGRPRRRWSWRSGWT